MKKIFGMMVISGLLAVILSGCAGFGTDTNIGNTTVNNFGGGEPTSQQTTPKMIEDDDDKVVIIHNQRDLLTLKIFAEGSSADAKTMANKINQSLAGALSSNAAKIVTTNNADLRLTIRPKLNIIDKAGEYYRINANVAIDIKDINAKRIYGAKNIKIAGGRALGKDKAISQLSEASTEQASEWIQNCLKNIADNEINVDILKIKLSADTDADEYNEKVNIISQNIGKLGGIINYSFAGLDKGTKVAEYRVVYFKDSYPSGIANAVGALLDSATDLK